MVAVVTGSVQSDPGIAGRLPDLHPLTGVFEVPEDVAGALLTVDSGWVAR